MNIKFTLLLITLLPLAAPAREGQSTERKEIPTVNFCEMVRRPSAYFDRPIRIAATMELGDEGSTLNDVKCPRSHNDQIGVGFVELPQQDKSLSKDFGRIRNGDWDTQPRVVAIGILRNKSRRDFEWYQYRFELIRLESIQRDDAEEINTFGGTLRSGMTYRGMVRTDKDSGLSFELPLRILPHHAMRVEWTNLDQFPVLKSLRGRQQQQIVFRVASDEVRQVSELRWDRTVRLEILLIE